MPNSYFKKIAKSSPQSVLKRRGLLLAGGAFLLHRLAGADETAKLSVRVTDENGLMSPCTVMLRSAGGAVVTRVKSYLGGFRSAGDFEQTLPAGPVTLTITRGFDFAAFQQNIQLKPGEAKHLEVRLLRRSPLRAEGWLCGDNHVHMMHGESRIKVDFEYLALTARAEGLDYMSVAQKWNLPEQTAAASEAECKRVSTADCMLTWNMEAPKNYFRGDVSHCLGHGWLLGARPVDASGRDAAVELTAMSAGDFQSDKTPVPNFESHAYIHAQGGLVSYTHPCRWWQGKWGGRGIYPAEESKFVSNLAQELPFDTIAGPTYDTLDVLMQTREREVNEQGQQLWFLLLNKGYRIPATASSDASFDNEGRAVPGGVRVYTHIQGERSIGSITAAMKNGRNFVTSGPLLSLLVQGREPGDVITFPGAGEYRARVRAWASGVQNESLTRIDLISNGEVVASVEPPRGSAEFEHEFRWRQPSSGWVIARCFGANRDHQVAITNPIYFEVPGTRAPARAKAKVRVTVEDEATAKRLGGVCTVVEMIGRTPRELSRHEIRSGIEEINVPATARLRIEVPGYAPQTRSIFLDGAGILEPVLNMRVEQLLKWETFERMRSLLSDVRLDFRMSAITNGVRTSSSENRNRNAT